MIEDKRVKEYRQLAMQVAAAPRAYGERHVIKLCRAVESLADMLKAAKAAGGSKEEQ